jgi:predicted alpha/beta-fold hydrolase
MILQTPYAPPPRWQYNAHLQTIAPNRLRKKPPIAYTRSRIHTPDGAHLSLDWSKLPGNNHKLAILTHGLEGSSDRMYMLGMAHTFNDLGFDVLAWNTRSCDGAWVPNHRLYFHGEIDDIHLVTTHACQQGYTQIVMVGFSMGASITLKYLGTHGANILPAIKAGVTFSCPAELGDCARYMDNPQNRIYKRLFLTTMKAKVQRIAAENPGIGLPVQKLKQVRSWYDFDDWFSAPLWNFTNADALYAAGSANRFVEGITVPTLLVNAANDPMLPLSCMPFGQAQSHQYFHFEQTAHGGHVGFSTRQSKLRMWSEIRAAAFVNEIVGI